MSKPRQFDSSLQKPQMKDLCSYCQDLSAISKMLSSLDRREVEISQVITDLKEDGSIQRM